MLSVWMFSVRRAFGRDVDLGDPVVIAAMNRNAAAFVVAESFGKVGQSVLGAPASCRHA